MRLLLSRYSGFIGVIGAKPGVRAAGVASEAPPTRREGSGARTQGPA